MKNFVRLSVLALAVSGFAASSVASNSQKLPSHATATHANIVINMPAPLCAPWSGGVGCW